MNTKNAVIENFTEGPLTKQLFVFSIPLMAGNLLQTLYTLVDMAIVGQFCGSVGLSAVSTSGQIMMLLYGLGIALGVGGQILIAQQVGNQDRAGVSATIGTAFSLTAIVSVVVTVLSIIFRRDLLCAMNVPEAALEDAIEYMFWCGIGIPFNSIYSSMSSVLRGLGDSKHPTLFMAVSACANALLDYVLVAMFEMGAKGAAIATSMSQLLACISCIVFICLKHESLGIRIEAKTLKIDSKTAVTMAKLSAPLAVQTISINISMMFINSWINAYGVVASAVGGVGTKLYSLNSIVSGAMMTATATFTGQNIAAGRIDRVKQTMKAALLFGLLYWLFSLALCVFLPEEMFSLFTTDADVLAMAPDYMHIMILMYLGFALMSPCNGFMNGIGNVKLGLVIALVDGVVARMSLSLLFADVFGLGLYGYWWGSSLAGFVTVIWGWLYYFSGHWKKRKLLIA